MSRALIALLLASVVGCGTVRTPSDGEPGASFPHSASYGLASAHGQDAVEADASCLACHPAEVAVDDTAAPSVPACKSCHASYPHPDDYSQGSEHGADWGDDCHGCHGERGDHVPAGQLDAVCVSCHTFPHPSGWLRADHHGLGVLEAGDSQACQVCHTDTSLCTSCHESYPHGDDWHSEHREAAIDTCFGACHDGANPELPGEVTCDDCHGGR